MTKYEVCNQEYDKCPGCGRYKGQYHDGECLRLKDDQNNNSCRDDDQNESVLKNEDTKATNLSITEQL